MDTIKNIRFFMSKKLKVWLKILFIIETWISTQLEKDLSSLKMLREIYS